MSREPYSKLPGFASIQFALMRVTHAFPCHARPEAGPFALLYAEYDDGTTEALGLATRL